MVTIPPESWINSAHTNNCRILGTFITEFKDGSLVCEQFLGSREQIDQVVQKLVDLTVYFGFDGWLINIENPVQNVENLKYFVGELRNRLRAVDPLRYKIVWYDSVVDESGKLDWQNELNEKNKAFFELSDAFFVNYTWKEDNLARTKQNASERAADVFVGVDVFGRGRFI